MSNVKRVLVSLAVSGAIIGCGYAVQPKAQVALPPVDDAAAPIPTPAPKARPKAATTSKPVPVLHTTQRTLTIRSRGCWYSFTAAVPDRRQDTKLTLTSVAPGCYPVLNCQAESLFGQFIGAVMCERIR